MTPIPPAAKRTARRVLDLNTPDVTEVAKPKAKAAAAVPVPLPSTTAAPPPFNLTDVQPVVCSAVASVTDGLAEDVATCLAPKIAPPGGEGRGERSGGGQQAAGGHR